MEHVREQNHQEQKIESRTTSNTSVWVKPTLEIISVSSECTTYAGILDARK